MKKKYIAPSIAIEHYELTQAIASCDMKIGYLDADCVKNDPDSTKEMKDLAWSYHFTTGNCDLSVIAGNDYDGICYHTSANAAFNS